MSSDYIFILLIGVYLHNIYYYILPVVVTVPY
nr:MAG TPA: hypothetical protein [Caudoviricetes sp.]